MDSSYLDLGIIFRISEKNGKMNRLGLFLEIKGHEDLGF